MTIKCEKISKDEMLEAIKLGVKEAIHEMMETGDGYTGIIIRDFVLAELKEGVMSGIYSAMPLPSDILDSISNGINNALPDADDIQDTLYRATFDGMKKK
jgi:hypothetical protein